MSLQCFHNMRLFDGTGESLQDGKAVLVSGDRIEAVVDVRSMEEHPGFKRVDLNGWTMLPGLIDAHVHPTVPLALELNTRVILQMGRQVAMNFNNFLKYGVTTIRDVGSFARKMLKWRAKIDSGQARGPRIVTSLSFITSPGGVPEMAPTLNSVQSLVAGGQFVERHTDPERVRQTADRLIDQGANWLKTQYSEESFLYHGRLNYLSDECFNALMEVSRRRGVPVAMHHTEAVGFRKGVSLGVASMEHCAGQPLDDRDVATFVEKGMCIVPTIKAIADCTEPETVLDWLTAEGREDFMPEPYRQTVHGIELLLSKPYPPPDYKEKFYTDLDFMQRATPVIIENVSKIRQAGGKIGVGSDSCGTGLSFSGQYWRELWRMTQAGFSNARVLALATRVNAEIIGLGDRVGTIEPGKLADLAIVQGNPLEDISAVKNVRRVIKGGQTVFTG